MCKVQNFDAYRISTAPISPPKKLFNNYWTKYLLLLYYKVSTILELRHVSLRYHKHKKFTHEGQTLEVCCISATRISAPKKLFNNYWTKYLLLLYYKLSTTLELRHVSLRYGKNKNLHIQVKCFILIIF